MNDYDDDTGIAALRKLAAAFYVRSLTDEIREKSVDYFTTHLDEFLDLPVTELQTMCRVFSIGEDEFVAAFKLATSLAPEQVGTLLH